MRVANIVISDLSTDSSSFSARMIDDDGSYNHSCWWILYLGLFTGMNLGATTKALLQQRELGRALRSILVYRPEPDRNLGKCWKWVCNWR